MRIAQLVSAYYPQLGGVETHVRRLAEGCVMAGDEVTVLTHYAGDRLTEEMVGSVRVLRFPLTVRSEAYPLSLGLFRYLHRQSAEFDLIHVHNYHTIVGQAALRSSPPLVFTPHYHGTGHTMLSALFHQVYRSAGGRLFAAAQAVICVTAAERELVLQNFPCAAGKVTIIPNGTDLRALVSRRDGRLGEESGGGRLVLAGGRLSRYKNIDLVIKAFRALPSPATLVIVGDGQDRDRLEQIAQSGDCRCPVRFAGRVSDEEMDALLAEAAVVTSASDHEAFGLLLAEGMLAGARVVASAIAAHREVGELAGDHAPITFVNPRDTTQFSAAMAAALDSGRLPAGSVQLPSWGDVVDRTRKLYSDVHAGSDHLGGRTA